MDTILLPPPPSRSPQDRLGVQLGSDRDGRNSGSREGRSDLERLSDPPPVASIDRVPPSFESGRLQEAPEVCDETMRVEEADDPTGIQTRTSAILRLGADTSSRSKKGKAILIAKSSKSVGKRKVAPILKRVVRSPLQGPSSKRTVTKKSSTATRRKAIKFGVHTRLY
ncbi:unnamed protein product [Eruca vesicaria subsp. sativa]|uniref:Uncharacterized protein n=1 Tax=Eruca vesicaria subsp. sativa TaxID=29727 RepID=A0ABC8KF95_ERUVS|nr:unnamed protein product [Eruca vesicaria subsp. sativa]